MAKLKVGSVVQIAHGGDAEILDEFGTGGQGTVYKVKFQNEEYALKWYHKGVFKGNEKAFYDNLKSNINSGAPNDKFLWPLYISNVCDGTFGYIMNIRPQGYYELTDFFIGSAKRKQVRFKSFDAIATAAINIISAFRELHNSGYSYQDINNGNFFINPNNGDVLICDNDNVSPNKVNLGILGKQRYMAPEIVTMKNDPDKDSDRFSLAVILFRLLFINHPLEGQYSTPPCMTKELEKKFYGEEPIFIYDPIDKRNRPVKGTDKNLKLLWNVYPDYIKQVFIKAFSKDVMLKKSSRIIEKEWLNIFIKFKSSITQCPHCKQETFIVNSGSNTCIECGKTLSASLSISFNNITVPLFEGVKIVEWHLDHEENDINKELAQVVSNPKNPALLGLKNISKKIWTVTLTDGTKKELYPGKIVPLKEGFKIEFIDELKNIGKIIK